jgi:hypothetical protein
MTETGSPPGAVARRAVPIAAMGDLLGLLSPPAEPRVPVGSRNDWLAAVEANIAEMLQGSTSMMGGAVDPGFQKEIDRIRATLRALFQGGR